MGFAKNWSERPSRIDKTSGKYSSKNVLTVAGSLSGWGDLERDFPEPVLARDEARALHGAARRVAVRPDLLEYLVALTAGLRASRDIDLEVSPRGALGLLEAARGVALVAGRDFVVPAPPMSSAWEIR